MKSLLLVLIVLCGCVKIYSQAVPDTADLILAFPNEPSSGFFNIDSLMFDTTTAPPSQCARGRFFVIFKTAPLHDSAALNGDGMYSLDDIDDLHVDYFLCRQLDSLAGNLSLKPIEASDSSVYYGRAFFVSFDEYIRVDTVLSYFSAMDSVASVDLASGCYKNLASSSDPGFKVLVGKDEIEGTTGNPWYKRFSNLGFEFNLHLCKIPLAWEITKGASSVYVGVDDGTDDVPSTSTEHRDLHLTSNGGNFYYTAQPGEGLTKFLPLYNHHGMQSLSVINAEDNGLGIVGFAPGLRTFLTDKSAGTGPNPYTLVDVSSDAGTQLPHVMSCSYYYPMGSGSNQRYIDAINSGICVVASNINEEIIASQFESSPGFKEYYEVGGVDADYNPPEAGSLGGLFVDGSNNNGTEDVKVLCVFEYNQSTIQPYESDQNCPRGTTQTYAPQWIDGKPMSIGINKFATGSARIAQKSAALIDLVVPQNFAAITMAGTSSAYEYWAGSNSRAVPQAAAVVGLMNSVQDRLGMAGKNVQKRVYDIMTFTADKIQDVQPQHTAQQSISSEPSAPDGVLSRFVIDNNGTPDNPNDDFPSMRIFAVPNRAYSEQYPDLLDGNGRLKVDYVVQNNDDLKRSWAPRFGFGRLNAFRCLAHSIPKTVGGVVNVKYEYTTGQSLDWDHGHALNGRKFLHLGKFKDATTEVLVGGGLVPTDEPEYMNNNGKTIVGSATLLVPDNSTLVIDGILEKAAGGPSRQITTSGSGVILATGWATDVALQGVVRLSDLRVKRSTGGTAMRTTGSSEVYDTLWVRGSGDLVVESGTLTLKPGALINIYDGAKIIVKPGAEVVLMYTSRIGDRATSYLAKRIVLEAGTDGNPGGKLTVAEGAEEAVIDADIEVNSGAEMVIGSTESEKWPSVYLKSINVKSGGKLKVSHGSAVKRVPNVESCMITVQAGNGLLVPTGATVRLDVPMTVATGGSVMVDPGGVLKVGALNIEPSGKVTVSPGSTLQLIDRENTINGILIAEGTSGQKVTIKATVEDGGGCATLAKKMFANLNVYPTAWLYNTAEPGVTPLEAALTCYLQIRHTVFENTFTTVTNAPIVRKEAGVLDPGHLSFCDFKTDRTIYVGSTLEADYRTQTLFAMNCERSALLKLRNQFGGVSLIDFNKGWNLTRSLDVDNCTFKDHGGLITSEAYRELSRENNDYPIVGLAVSTTKPVSVHNCTMAFLYNGMQLDKCYNSTVSSNTLGAMETAVKARYLLACDNTISGCLYVFDAAQSYLFDNVLGGSMSVTENVLFPSGTTVGFIGSALLQAKSGLSEARNNVLTNYGTGFNLASGHLNIGDLFKYKGGIPNDGENVAVYGRNYFHGYIAEDDNPYQKGVESSDVFLEASGTAFVKCGKNVFRPDFDNPPHDYQIYKKTPGTVTIDISTNEWGSDALNDIRAFHVNPLVVIPNDVDDLRNGQHKYPDEVVCGIWYREHGDLEFDDCVELPEDDNTLFDPARLLGSIDPANFDVLDLGITNTTEGDTNLAKSVYVKASFVLSNNAISPQTRISALAKAFIAAQEHPKSDSVLIDLSNRLRTIANDTSIVDAVRERAILSEVERLEMAGEYDSARVWLDSIRTGLFTGIDSTLIDCMDRWLGVKADTVLSFSQKRDTLNQILTDEMEYLKFPSGMMKQGQPQYKVMPPSSTQSVSLHPNPAENYLVVEFSGFEEDETIVTLVDEFGRECLDATTDRIGHGGTVRMNIGSILPGMYFVRVNDKTHQQSAVLVVIR